MAISNYSYKYYEETMITRYDLGSSVIVGYVYSLYFILMTMTTIGYGDITPVNPIEIGFTLFVMLICSALFGFTLNSIN